MGDECVPADGQGAVDGGAFSLGDVVEWIPVTMANHHLDRQQLVVSRTVTCSVETHRHPHFSTQISSVKNCYFNTGDSFTYTFYKNGSLLKIN